MSKEMMARAFNEWMRRYTEDPRAFEAEFQTVQRFLKEKSDGVEPSYGEASVECLHRIAEELEAAA